MYSVSFDFQFVKDTIKSQGISEIQSFLFKLLLVKFNHCYLSTFC